MITIQDAGSEILGGNPRNLYIMFGSEYGIKQTYLHALSEHYGSCTESYDALDLFKSFNVKSLIPRKDGLYICRYDDAFYKEAEKASKRMNLSNIPGTVVMIYDDERKFKKLDKLFPDSVVRIDPVSSSYVSKYLKRDFPNIDDRHINLISSNVGCYGQAKIICGQMDVIRDDLYDIDYKDLLLTFGLERKFTENQMMLRAAARDFNGVMLVVDSFEGDAANLVNGMCHVSVELDKVMDGNSGKSDFAKYADKWTREDVYNFFDHAYTQTMRLRSGFGSDAYQSLVFLAALLKFKKIPSVDEVRGA